MVINFVLIWNRVRGRMRFWGKTKYGDKKTSREKLICGADSLDGDYGDTGPLLGESALSKIQNMSISKIETDWNSPPPQSRSGKHVATLQS